MGKCVQKTVESTRHPLKGPQKFKWSDRTLYLSTPKAVRIVQKYDEWYLKSFDTFYTNGKRSINEKKSIRGEKYVPSERVVTLAVPLHYRNKYKPRRPVYYHVVPKAAREAQAKPRTTELAIPHKLTLHFTKELVKNLHMPKEGLDRIQALIDQSPETFTPEMEAHFQPSPKEKKWAAGDQKFKKSVERLSKPKRMRPRPRPPFRKRKPLGYLLKRIISTLYRPKPPIKYDPMQGFRISPSALTYQSTERIDALAAPRVDKSGEKYIYGQINPYALTYIATENIIKLAQPKAKAAATDLDLKEDPFAVAPAALKYRPTQRILNLAKPKE